MSPDYLRYLRTRGLREEQGFILIPHDCQHLHPPIEIQMYGKLRAWNTVSRQQIDEENKAIPGFSTAWVCDIHDSPERPKICQTFHGQKRGKNHTLFYVPPECTMKKE
jgi:hypothetical protein